MSHENNKGPKYIMLLRICFLNFGGILQKRISQNQDSCLSCSLSLYFSIPIKQNLVYFCLEWHVWYKPIFVTFISFKLSLLLAFHLPTYPFISQVNDKVSEVILSQCQNQIILDVKIGIIYCFAFIFSSQSLISFIDNQLIIIKT